MNGSALRRDCYTWNSVEIWKFWILPEFESYGIEVLFWEPCKFKARFLNAEPVIFTF